MGLNIKFYDDKQKEGEIVSVGYIPVDTICIDTQAKTWVDTMGNNVDA